MNHRAAGTNNVEQAMASHAGGHVAIGVGGWHSGLEAFDLTGERLAARPHHRTPQCVQPGPRRLVTADSHHAVQAVRVNLSARYNVGLVLPLRPGETCEGGAKR